MYLAPSTWRPQPIWFRGRTLTAGIMPGVTTRKPQSQTRDATEPISLNLRHHAAHPLHTNYLPPHNHARTHASSLQWPSPSTTERPYLACNRLALSLLFCLNATVPSSTYSERPSLGHAHLSQIRQSLVFPPTYVSVAPAPHGGRSHEPGGISREDIFVPS